MNRLVIGILAHVDAGKTTLSEALLYRSGALRRLGRVDHQDAFLDSERLERERGITIFSKQALFTFARTEFQLVDTPGHVDFSAETERALRVLDYAVLVVSASDGVQSHTRTLWRLLRRYRVPTFLFVNKTDLPNAGRAALLAELRSALDGACVDFGAPDRDLHEEAATGSEQALTEYLAHGAVSDETLAALIAERRIFPCFFGAALRLEGTDALLGGLSRFTRMPAYPADFAARVYKITRDPQGARLTWLKVTGGTLRVKAVLSNRRPGLPEGDCWEEKADQLRVYSGQKYTLAETLPAGSVCAVSGLSRTFAGEGLGAEAHAEPPALEPVLAYEVLLPEGCDPHAALEKLRLLEEEDPQLHVAWNEALREIRVQLMGEIQLEVLQTLLEDRFGLRVGFGPGRIMYRETIAAPAVGIGHFEPLRHYAEVQLLLEPGERGSGLVFAADCPEEVLGRSWQRLVLTHLEEKTHPGVLTGAPVTDLKITLIAGRASIHHTEGGDFRQATYRAVRQGLMSARCVLLEPWYDFRLEVPPAQLGRALSDLQRRSAVCAPPQTESGAAVLTGRAPVAALRDYAREVTAYTRGQGRLACIFRGYEPCRDQESVVAAAGYDPRRDVENTPDSVFCAHGAGYVVPWDEVPAHAHVPCAAARAPGAETPPETGGGRMAAYAASAAQDRELEEIYERTYGPVRRREPPRPAAPAPAAAAPAKTAAARPQGPEYLLVDGYNIIFAWDELRRVADEDLATARQLLAELLSNYQGYRKCEIILVFDAYKVPNNAGSVLKYCDLTVVYTKEAETADAYIEKATYRLSPGRRVRVATSDGAEQLIILCHGAQRVTAEALHEEVARAEGEISAILDRLRRRRSDEMRAALARAARKRGQNQ